MTSSPQERHGVSLPSGGRSLRCDSQSNSINRMSTASYRGGSTRQADAVPLSGMFTVDAGGTLCSNDRTMRIEILGTGGFHPNQRRHTACVLLPDVGIAFDAGTSLFRLTSRLKVPDLHLFLSHSHLDHICGLTYLLVPMLKGEIRSCKLYATAKVHQAVEQCLFHDAVFPVWPGFQKVEIEPGRQYTIGPIEVSHQPLSATPADHGHTVAIGSLGANRDRSHT